MYAVFAKPYYLIIASDNKEMVFKTMRPENDMTTERKTRF